MNIWDNLTHLVISDREQIIRPFILRVIGREFTSADRYSAPKLAPLWLEWVIDLKHIKVCCPPMRSPHQTLENWMSLPMVVSRCGRPITYQAVCQRVPGWRVESHPIGYGYLWCMVPRFVLSPVAPNPDVPASEAHVGGDGAGASS